jgi:hypothetical protein
MNELKKIMENAGLYLQQRGRDIYDYDESVNEAQNPRVAQIEEGQGDMERFRAFLDKFESELSIIDNSVHRLDFLSVANRAGADPELIEELRKLIESGIDLLGELEASTGGDF